MKCQSCLLLALVLLGVGCGAGNEALEGLEVGEAPESAVYSLQEAPEPPAALAEEALAGPEQLGALRYGAMPPEFTRTEVLPGIAHYQLRLGRGKGPYEFVVLHRVVRERSPGRPAHTSRALFLLHGDGLDFQGAFLASTRSSAVPAHHSLALYMASRGVDVWGMDLRWASVPLLESAADFSFMSEWSLGSHVRDLREALEQVHRVRRATGSHSRWLALLGWSRGGTIGYAYLNEEWQRPARERYVHAFIPLDTAFKLGPEAEALRLQACSRARHGRQQLAGGRFEGGLMGPQPGVLLAQVGLGALLIPDVPVQPPHPTTFRQLALGVGAATYNFMPVPVPGYHLVAGVFNASGAPARLAYTHERYLAEVMAQARPYQSFTEVVESDELLCNEEDSPHDDALHRVRVPVLYVGAAGGFGRYGVHSTSLLGSRRVSVLLVQRKSAAAQPEDYGHADPLLADDADTTVWRPMLDWLHRQW